MTITSRSIDYSLHCTGCGREISAAVAQPRCDCTSAGTIEVKPDLRAARRTMTPASLGSRPATLLRYHELLPFLQSEPAMFPLVTPLVPAPVLAARHELGSLQIKDEGCQPSGSLKARPSAIAVARAAALGYVEIACSSSGNAAISLAAMAAAQGLRATVFVPQRIPRAKLAQLQVYGPRVVLVAGPYERAYALCESACEQFGWYNRNCAQDPYLVEGKKTCGLEIAEQTSSAPPDWVAVPIGDGCTITGIWKGLWEMAALGLTSSLPRMLGVQAVDAAAVHDAWAESRPLAAVEARYPDPGTVADSIAVTHPHNGERALDAVRSSGGAIATVGDNAIGEAILDLSRAGVLVEAASAATLAGIATACAEGLIEKGARVVAVGTGTGLKSLDLVASLLPDPPAPIEPTLDALTASLDA